ncbi:MAG: mechanosensitive ion channel family protein [bacterium]|nr:mechanosensitive ion channel family protein [bacterium]
MTSNTTSQYSGQTTINFFDFHQVILNYIDRFFNLLPNIFLGLLIFLLFYLLYRFLRVISERAMQKAKLAPSVIDALLSLLKYSVLGYGIILGLEPIFPRITSLLAGLGILGIAIGFAAKDTLANLIAGFSIFWDKPFEIGDIVTLDGTTGKVDRITLRTTRLVTPENYMVSIPNQNVINNKVINLTKLKKQRIVVPFYIEYTDSIENMRSEIQALFNQWQKENRILAEPAPQIVVTELRSPLPAQPIATLEAWVWIDPTDNKALTPFILREKILAILTYYRKITGQKSSNNVS